MMRTTKGTAADERGSLKRNKALLFALLLAYIYLRGIGDHGLMDPIEGANASVGLAMAAHGEWLSPRVGRSLFMGKTMGTWWLSALSLHVIGWSEAAVRLWPALSGLVMSLAAALAARSSRGAWLSAAVCASMTLCFSVSQLASSHALYAACMGLAMASILRVMRGDRRWAWGFHASAVAAFVVHGPEGLILPWLTLLLSCHITDRFDALLACAKSRAGAVVSLIGVGGYLSLLWAKAPMILRLMAWEAPKLLPASGALVLLIILAGSVPWTGFLISAVWTVVPRGIDALRSDEAGPGLLMVLWMGTFGAAALLMGDPLALAACVPPAAALVGSSLDEWTEQGKIAKIRMAAALDIFIVVPLLALGLPVASRELPPLRGAMLSLLPWATFVALFLFAVWHYVKTRQLGKFMRNASAAALLCLLPLAGAFDLLAEELSIRHMGLVLRDSLRDDDALIQYAMDAPSLCFYTMRDYVRVSSPSVPGVASRWAKMDDVALHLLWAREGRAFLLIPKDQQLLSPLPVDVHDMLEANGKLLLSNHGEPLDALAGR